VQALLDRGHAYVAGDGSGDVYFDVRSWPEYGSLTGQQLDDMLPAEDAPPEGKRDPRDFALWKGAKPTDPPTASWPTPWGRGRPGWHLECSTMAGKYLGDAFDIHGGGMDLKFPHHENEQAQSQAAGRPFAKYWMHSGWLTMAGEKMSKSLGNTAAVTEVVKRFPARAVRLYLAAPHYRSAVELSDDALTEAAAQLARIDSFTSRAVDTVGPTEPGKVPLEFIAAMDDDLGTPAAFAALFNEVRKGNQALADGLANEVAAALASVNAMLKVFGLNADDPVWEQGAAAGPDLAPVVDGLAQAWLDERQAARGRKDFAAADAIRDLFTSLGIKIEDTPDGARWSL
jgi:cysteinyl-tRNA synthetase